MNDQQLQEEVEWLVGSIKDPEKREMTLEELGVINKQSVTLQTLGKNENPSRLQSTSSHLLKMIRVKLMPTNPHCHLIQQIALAIHLKLKRQLLHFDQYKLHIECFEKSHAKQEEVEKQMNDKQRIAAALENQHIISYLHELVE